VKLQGVLDHLPSPFELEVVDGGDHSFKLPKTSSRSADFVHQQIVEKCLVWLDAAIR
jgi:hypothetical protein